MPCFVEAKLNEVISSWARTQRKEIVDGGAAEFREAKNSAASMLAGRKHRVASPGNGRDRHAPQVATAENGPYYGMVFGDGGVVGNQATTPMQ